MSAVKRSRQDQKRNAGKQHDADIPAHKRLKSTHDSEQTTTGLAALLSDPTTKLSARLTNGVVDKSASRVDDSKATISTGLNGDADHAISVSSQEEDSDDEAQEVRGNEVQALTNGTNGSHNTDAEMVDAEDNDDMAEDEQPSFGDMLKAQHPDVITVEAQSGAHVAATAIQPITGFSLGTVLQQALKTNDKDLLESCFELRDVQAIKNTIQRLPSPLVGQLLSSISERMYRRPGRAGALMLWVQWSLVAHGGYLAGQPEILQRLTALNQVMKQRAQGLQPLLRLKGKLDILHAQLELRRETQAARQERADDVDEEAVTYRESDLGTTWTEDDVDKPLQIEAGESEADDDEDPFNPEQQDDSADDGAEDGEDEEERMLDIEAEEDEEDESDEVDSEDDESDGDASEESFHTSEDGSEDDDESAVPSRRPI